MALPPYQAGGTQHWQQEGNWRFTRRGVPEKIVIPSDLPGPLGHSTQTMIYDITPPASERLPVWAGGTPLSRGVLCDLKRGDNITLSTLRATVHLGAHADAPSHYGVNASAIDKR